MRIGIDAKWFYTGNASGRVVVYNLVKHLCSSYTNHYFFIILDKKDEDKNFPFKNENVTLIYQGTLTNQISNIVSPFILKKYKLDVCVYQYFVPFFSKYKRVVFIHDVIFESNPEFFSFKEKLYFKTMKWLAKLSHGIITVSHNEAKRIAAFGYTGKKTKIGVVYNGVGEQFKVKENQTNESIVAVKEKYKLPTKTILYFGRLNERKNIRMLLQSFELVNDKNVKLVLAGSYDWKMFNLPALISDMQLQDRVIITGFVKDEDVAPLYASSTVFCYLSFDEGFGLPPLEAMASGIPLVVSAIGSIKEVCGNAAYYVNPFNKNEIAEKLNKILSNPDIARENIKYGLQRAKDFTWYNSSKQLINFLEKI